MTRRLGLLVRADRGGLGVQTREILEHLTPAAALVIRMDSRARGPELELGLPSVDYQRADVRVMEDFLAQIDVMLSVETFYEPFLVIEANRRGIERVLYANAELLSNADPAERADRYLWPAQWEYPFPERGEILPWPASMPARATSSSPALAAGHGRPLRLTHLAAPAMLDRDGKDVALEAMAYVTERVDLTVVGQPTPATWRNERTRVQWINYVDDLGELWAETDLHVIPRRYGCLSLPMIEAAAAGVPSLTTALKPQSDWFAPWPELLIDPGPAMPYPMKGNRAGIPVHKPSPQTLARAIDVWARAPEALEYVKARVWEWALARSWSKLLPQWQAALS